MKPFLWVLQLIMAFLFLFHGFIKISPPADLPDLLNWINDLSPGMSLFIGVIEILGALGLILPSLTRIQPQLTPLAAAGLALVMLFAAIWHFPREEFMAIGNNLVLLVITAFIAYARWKLHPIEPR